MHAMSVLGYLSKLKRSLELAFEAHFLHVSFMQMLILYQLTKFQCHIYFPSQDIKQNLLLSCYLGN